MGYHVKKELPCRLCGAPTTHRRTSFRDPQCLMCGIQRMVSNARGMSEIDNDARRNADLLLIRWADQGGIEKANKDADWKRGMRKRVERLRKLHGGHPPKESLTTPS